MLVFRQKYTFTFEVSFHVFFLTFASESAGSSVSYFFLLFLVSFSNETI